MDKSLEYTLENFKKLYPETKLVNFESRPGLGSVAIYSFREGYFVVSNDNRVEQLTDDFGEIMDMAKQIWDIKKEMRGRYVRRNR